MTHIWFPMGIIIFQGVLIIQFFDRISTSGKIYRFNEVPPTKYIQTLKMSKCFIYANDVLLVMGVSRGH